MKKNTMYRALLSLVLAGMLLIVCGAGVLPEGQEPADQPAETPAAAQPENRVEVGTVDELLAAIAPNTTVVLKEGDYDLSTASDYCIEDGGGYYSWELILGGAQLNISGIEGLRLVGQGQVSILARCRYADVIRFSYCQDLRLEGLILGHTQAPSGCTGDVLNLYACDNVTLENCRLFGCGVVGLTATQSKSVFLRNSQIDSCSNGAVVASGCRDMRLEDCKVSDCGLSQDGTGGDLFFLDRCRGFALVNCAITGNRVQELLQNSWSDQVALLGCRVEQNRFMNVLFNLQGRGVTVDKCSFKRFSDESYYWEGSALLPVTPEGVGLTSDALDSMELGRAEYAGPAPEQPAEPASQEAADKVQVHAATADELLAAIAPNTTILLDAGVYDLSATAGYGGFGSDCYCWEEAFDGFTLKLVGVQGLSIVGAGKGETVITASPRYAAVFSFQNCQDLVLRDFTAGHSEAPGYCTGNVLDFDGCRNVTVEGCGLYGCGVLGIWGMQCSGFAIRDSEIYECANGAAEFSVCTGLSFENCSIHDCDDGLNQIALFGCDMTWDDLVLYDGTHMFLEHDYLGLAYYD